MEQNIIMASLVDSGPTNACPVFRGLRLVDYRLWYDVSKYKTICHLLFIVHMFLVEVNSYLELICNNAKVGIFTYNILCVHNI